LTQQGTSKYPIEPIPGPDLISRCCFSINGIRSLDPATDFKFAGADHDQFPLALSVVWRKYAVERHDVDQHGEVIAKIKNDRNQTKKRQGRVTYIYIGYRTAMAQTIRAMRTDRQFGFGVTHVPRNTSRAHAHITIEHAHHPNGPAILPNDKRDLMSQLVDGMPMDAPPPDGIAAPDNPQL
jgi:hypothetical protein